jgi:ABC-type lipopolysaccharide export system ATPase subunit
LTPTRSGYWTPIRETWSATLVLWAIEKNTDGRRSYEAVGSRLEPGKQKEMRFAGGTAIEVGYRKPLKAETTRKLKRHSAFLFSILMDNPTVIFDPHAAGDLRNIVQTIVDNHNVAITG